MQLFLLPSQKTSLEEARFLKETMASQVQEHWENTTAAHHGL